MNTIEEKHTAEEWEEKNSDAMFLAGEILFEKVWENCPCVHCEHNNNCVSAFTNDDPC